MRIVLVIIGFLLASTLSFGQQLQPQQATPCDIQVQILTMGRQNAETQLAQVIVQLRDMEKKVAEAEAKTKSVEKK